MPNRHQLVPIGVNGTTQSKCCTSPHGVSWVSELSANSLDHQAANAWPTTRPNRRSAAATSNDPTPTPSDNGLTVRNAKLNLQSGRMFVCQSLQ